MPAPCGMQSPQLSTAPISNSISDATSAPREVQALGVAWLETQRKVACSNHSSAKCNFALPRAASEVAYYLRSKVFQPSQVFRSNSDKRIMDAISRTCSGGFNMKRMESKYAGTCRACSGNFPAGTLIDYDRSGARGRKAQHVDCAAVPVEEGAPGHGPGCYGECDGLYDCSAPAGDTGYGEFGSTKWNNRPTHEIRTSGGTFYQRAGGRCEDAPCCGCCTF